MSHWSSGVESKGLKDKRYRGIVKDGRRTVYRGPWRKLEGTAYEMARSKAITHNLRESR